MPGPPREGHWDAPSCLSGIGPALCHFKEPKQALVVHHQRLQPISSCRVNQKGGLTLRTTLPYKARLVSMGQLCMARSTSCTHAFRCKARTSSPENPLVLCRRSTQDCAGMCRQVHQFSMMTCSKTIFLDMQTSSPFTIATIAAESAPPCPACISQGWLTGVTACAPGAGGWCTQWRQNPAGRRALAQESARAARCRSRGRPAWGSRSCGSWCASPAAHPTFGTPVDARNMGLHSAA